MQSIAAALACLAVLYTLMPRLPRGLPRLLLLLPCLPVFAWVPFSTRPHALRAILAFSFLWICPSKLLLLAWDLSPDYAGHGFLYFFVTTVFPLRFKPTSARRKPGAISLFLHSLMFLLFLAVLNACRYRDSLSIWAIHALYCLQLFLGLQWVLGLSADLAIVLLGVEIYPHFDKPFLASSLSDFWGRRWNLVASHMLRETVYAPTLRIMSWGRQQDTVKHTKQSQSYAKSEENKKAVSISNKSIQTRGLQQNPISKHQRLQQESFEFGNTTKHPLPARAIAMLATFLASGLIHELIFCCINQAQATWEVTIFFLLHGFATILEVFLRRELPARWKFPRPVAILCTLGFLFFSAAWLFMPPVTRAGSDLRIIAEFHHVQSAIPQLFKRYRAASIKM